MLCFYILTLNPVLSLHNIRGNIASLFLLLLVLTHQQVVNVTVELPHKFFFLNLYDTSPFCGATDTPVLDF